MKKELIIKLTKQKHSKTYHVMFKVSNKIIFEDTFILRNKKRTKELNRYLIHFTGLEQ